MICAIYGHRHPYGKFSDERTITLPLPTLDCAASDAEAERRFGRGLNRIASWLAREPAQTISATGTRPVG